MRTLLTITSLMLISVFAIWVTTNSASGQNSNLSIDMENISKNLATGLTFRTISFENHSQIDYSQFKDMQVFIDKTYPLINSKLEKHVINNYSLLYKWTGTDPSLKAIVLMGHQDVVPAEQPDRWTHPPFAGVIDNGTIYGRGSVDNKISVFGILESVEHLLSEGFQPKHTIYLVFGHDEELGGADGVKAIVEYLKANNAQISFVVDEGGYVIVNDINGIVQPIALIGVAEKGYLDIQLSAHVQPGHSSFPLRENAIQILAMAIKSLQDNPMPAVFDDITLNELKLYAPFVNQTYKEIFENPLKNISLSELILSKDKMYNAAIRTVITPTIFSGGEKSNIIPADASATLNVRIHTGDTIQSVLDHVKNVINDSRIEIKTINSSAVNPSPLAVTNHPSYEVLVKLIKDTFGENVSAIPWLTFGGTDSKYFQNSGYGEAVYRFNPVMLGPSEIKGVHGYDEHVPVEIYEKYVKFMILLIMDSNNLT